MIESLQEVDTFGTKEKIQNIQKMIDERKKIHQLENREVISKQDIKQSEIGFANFQIRNDVLLEEIKKGELIAIEKLQSNIKQGPIKEATEEDPEKYRETYKKKTTDTFEM